MKPENPIPRPTNSYHRMVDIYDEIQKEKSHRYRTLLSIVGVAAIGLGAGGFLGYYSLTDRIIPSDEIVQSGFIPPSEVHIGCYNYNKNNEPETIQIIRGEFYRLKDKDGKPVLEPVPKETRIQK